MTALPRSPILAPATPRRADRPFAQVDVFSEVPHAGNPVAVVLHADDADELAMQRVARWTNLSETAFVMAPTAPGADYRVRIFTPDRELPFAGHPTLGACHAWLASTGAAEDRDRVVQECAAGLVELRRTDGRWAFAAPPLTQSGPVDEDELGVVLEAFGVEDRTVLDARWGVNGPAWMVILLASAADVLAVRPGYARVDVGLVGPHPSGAAEAIEVRAFLPGPSGTMTEDPATGSLNAAVAQWLLGSGRLTAPYVARQGTALDRMGRIHITEDPSGTIWVGGSTTTLIEGVARL